MSPALLITLLLSALLAILPVRRLHEAGWSSGAKLTAWLVYAAGVVLSLEAGLGARYLVPILVVLYVLPFVAGQSRLEKAGRLLGAARPAAPPRPVIDVTPPDSAGDPQPEAQPTKRRGRKPPIEYR